MNIDNHKSINNEQMQGMDALHNVSNIFQSYQKGNVKLINADCMEIMAQYPDKYFDLAVVDPPYGINIDNEKSNNFVMTKHKSKHFDLKTPEKAYFQELFRISKNQIIWGGNYFIDFLYNTKCFLIWNKLNPMIGKFADAELAWTNFDSQTYIYNQSWIGFGRHFIEKTESIHPTQKPINLYKKCFDFSKVGKTAKVIDTHLGSGSSAIAAYYFGFFEFIGCEIDAEYFEKSIKRFEVETMQQVLSL
jgi:site-specific DNA-methyltransferase (adenine-specific)